DKYHVPRIAFVNKLDRVGADFLRVVDMIVERLGARAVPIQLPIGSEDSFCGVVDLLRETAIIYTDDLGTQSDETEIPEDMREQVARYREALVEAIVETDEDLMARYLEGETLSVDELKAALRKATISAQITPVLCGSAFKNKGVQPLLDAVVDYLPSPLDIPPVRGVDPRTGEEVERAASDDEPFSALCFKIMTDPYVGRLAFFRVYSGVLRSGSYVLNSTRGKKERIGRVLQMHANHREEIDAVYAGDIAAAVGLRETTTGDTLCADDAPIVLESL